MEKCLRLSDFFLKPPYDPQPGSKLKVHRTLCSLYGAHPLSMSSLNHSRGKRFKWVGPKRSNGKGKKDQNHKQWSNTL
jgi:hypothetical protein